MFDGKFGDGYSASYFIAQVRPEALSILGEF
jgi:hypothetical protein